MFDAHTHLQDRRLAAHRQALFQNALATDVNGACTCGTEPDDWPGVAHLAADGEEHQPAAFRIHPAFGVHPWYCANLPSDWREQLERWLEKFPGAAVGEIGIDGLRPEPERALQHEVLLFQLELAIRLGRTVNLHGARAWGPLAEILAPFAARLSGIVLHAFSASAEVLRTFLAQGAYISFGGTLCNPAARRARGAAMATPPERLLIETDTPDLMPREGSPLAFLGDGPGLNQPANLVPVTAALAQIKGCDATGIADLTTQNSLRVYNLKEKR